MAVRCVYYMAVDKVITKISRLTLFAHPVSAFSTETRMKIGSLFSFLMAEMRFQSHEPAHWPC